MRTIKIALGIVAIFLFYKLVSSYPIMILWNYVGFPQIDFGKALALSFLSDFLTKETFSIKRTNIDL